MAHEAPSPVTKLLQGWSAGERSASDALLPFVDDELCRLAHHHLRNEHPHHTLQSTALVNEADLRLVGQNLPKWGSRARSFAIAAQLMRQSRVVELRFFAGLSLEETSEVMGIATATVQRDWTAARAWLHREISRSPRT